MGLCHLQLGPNKLNVSGFFKESYLSKNKRRKNFVCNVKVSVNETLGNCGAKAAVNFKREEGVKCKVQTLVIVP